LIFEEHKIFVSEKQNNNTSSLIQQICLRFFTKSVKKVFK